MAEVIERLPFEAYVELQAEHSTGLRDMLESPLLYQYNRSVPREDKDAMRVGRAGHTATLEPDRFLLEYACWRNDKSGKARRRFGKVWQAFREANTDKTILTEPQYQTALGVRDSIRKHKVARRFLEEDGRNELTITWVDEKTGLFRKVRIDRLCSGLVDIKLTHDPSPRRFMATAADFDYATQLSMYRHAVRLAGLGDPAVFIAAAGSKAPHDCVVFELDREMLALGDARWRLALDRVAECKAKNEWPGLAPDEPVLLELPPWLSATSDNAIDLGTEVIQ